MFCTMLGSRLESMQRGHVTGECILQGGVQGSIRSWVLWDDIAVFLYNIKDNRWCGNIGRAHKSNGIYLIVDLQVAHCMCINVF